MTVHRVILIIINTCQKERGSGRIRQKVDVASCQEAKFQKCQLEPWSCNSSYRRAIFAVWTATIHNYEKGSVALPC